MTNQEKSNKITDLATKNANMQYVWSALALAGGIAGVVYASKKDKRFWGKVGYFFIGSFALSIPTGIVVVPKMNKNKAEIKKLRGATPSLSEILKDKVEQTIT